MGAWSSPNVIPWQRIVGLGIPKVLIPGTFYCQQLANTSMAGKRPREWPTFLVQLFGEAWYGLHLWATRFALAERPTFMVFGRSAAYGYGQSRSRDGRAFLARRSALWPTFMRKSKCLFWWPTQRSGYARPVIWPTFLG